MQLHFYTSLKLFKLLNQQKMELSKKKSSKQQKAY